MARYLTARDTTVRARWASFLEPHVGNSRQKIPVATLAKAIGASTERRGDGTWQVWDWLEAERTVSPGLAFVAGEALRTCGIGWSTGLGALWSAGYFGEYARRLANVAHGDPLPSIPIAQGYPSGPDLTARDLAAIVGSHAPFFASPSLARDLYVNAEWLDADPRSFAWFIGTYPVGQLFEAVQRKDQRALPYDELLVHAAALGDSQPIEIEIRERLVWTLVFEWAIKAASMELREGRIANLAGLLAARPRLLIESEREAAFARARDDAPITSPPQTNRRKKL